MNLLQKIPFSASASFAITIKGKNSIFKQRISKHDLSMKVRGICGKTVDRKTIIKYHVHAQSSGKIAINYQFDQVKGNDSS